MDLPKINNKGTQIPINERCHEPYTMYVLCMYTYTHIYVYICIKCIAFVLYAVFIKKMYIQKYIGNRIYVYLKI